MDLPVVFPVAGVGYHQLAIAELEPGDYLLVVRDRTNPADPDGMKVVTFDGLCVGQLRRSDVASLVGSGFERFDGSVDSITPGPEHTWVKVRLGRTLPARPAPKPLATAPPNGRSQP